MDEAQTERRRRSMAAPAPGSTSVDPGQECAPRSALGFKYQPLPARRSDREPREGGFPFRAIRIRSWSSPVSPWKERFRARSTSPGVATSTDAVRGPSPAARSATRRWNSTARGGRYPAIGRGRWRRPDRRPQGTGFRHGRWMRSDMPELYPVAFRPIDLPAPRQPVAGKARAPRTCCTRAAVMRSFAPESSSPSRPLPGRRERLG